MPIEFALFFPISEKPSPLASQGFLCLMFANNVIPLVCDLSTNEVFNETLLSADFPPIKFILYFASYEFLVGSFVLMFITPPTAFAP